MVTERVRASAELGLLAEPVLSICCFRYRPATWTDEARLDALNDVVLYAVRSIRSLSHFGETIVCVSTHPRR